MPRPIERPLRLLTVGLIAQETGQPVHRIEYILATRTHIQPAALAGQVRLYSQTALVAIRAELDAIATRRTGRVRLALVGAEVGQ